jgi:hypothetical protein
MGGAVVKCCVNSCLLEATTKCCWKHFEIVEGVREFTGKKCDLKLCAVHQTTVTHGKSLCMWHVKVGTEQGLIK